MSSDFCASVEAFLSPGGGDRCGVLCSVSCLVLCRMPLFRLVRRCVLSPYGVIRRGLWDVFVPSAV